MLVTQIIPEIQGKNASAERAVFSKFLERTIWWSDYMTEHTLSECASSRDL